MSIAPEHTPISITLFLLDTWLVSFKKLYNSLRSSRPYISNHREARKYILHTFTIEQIHSHFKIFLFGWKMTTDMGITICIFKLTRWEILIWCIHYKICNNISKDCQLQIPILPGKTNVGSRNKFDFRRTTTLQFHL